MRKPLVIAAATAALLAAPAGATAPAPHLVLDTTRPMTVHGVHFAAGEHVRVTVFVATKTATRSIVATVTGSFTVRFAHMSATHCGLYGARAVGSAGSKAMLRFIPECAPGPVDQ